MEVQKLINKHMKGVVGRKEFRQMTHVSRLREDLGLDSMKMILALNSLCSDLQIDILELDPAEVIEITTIGELENFLSKEITK